MYWVMFACSDFRAIWLRFVYMKHVLSMELKSTATHGAVATQSA
jgi:hypothetical protein